jgi:hypothetical protein
MPTNIKCPTCKRALEIPDELIGKKVKCPACKMIFPATPGGPPPPAKPESSQRPPSRPKSEEEVRVRRKSPPAYEVEDEEEEEEEPRVRKKPIRRREEDDEEDEEEEEEERPRARRKAVRRDEEEEEEDEDEEEEEVRPRRRRKPAGSSAQRARSAVLVPAICLMITGGLGIALAGAALAIDLGGLTLLAPADKEDKEEDGLGKVQWVSSQARSIRGSITAMCWGLAVLGGGIQMKNLTHYKTVLSSCILAMLPCNPCCLLGFPFGIWGLIAINRADVKREFDYEHD